MVEYWDIYTMNRLKTGRLMERGAAFVEGAYHLVVHACVFNDKGEMLIQQRQKDKEGWPSYWDITVGGSALAGETSQEAVMRELKEELGLALDLAGVRPHFSITFDNGFDDTFLILQAVRWASRDEILAMIDAGIFIPYFKSKIDMCFELVGQYGAIKRS
ncbi:TPA: NUDIX domain-containing protein [Streptococcus equi subsp. zooepidemicus]|nr:NUDIX domain-containing protein [Streptococcus equi subsp. zooepidemicus]